MKTTSVLAGAALLLAGAAVHAQEPAYLADRGPGIPMSQFGTFVEPGERLFYLFYEYTRTPSFEYHPSELGAEGGEDFLGRLTENEGLLYFAYGISDRLAVDSYILAQEAAVEGRGVAMTIGPFATEEIKMGRLVQPFPLLVPHRHQWQFACSSENRMKPKIKRFEDWLVKQVAADPTLEAYRERGKAK